MQSSLYVSLSAQMSLQKRLDTVAHNVANATTAGFRSEEVKFDTVLSQTSTIPVAYASLGETYLSQRSGAIVPTGNPLDLAIKGDAWFAITTDAGQVYTRDGRLDMANTGELKTVRGHTVLDGGGAPIVLDPNAGTPAIAADGMITQNNRQVGAIGLFRIPANEKLQRFDNSGVITQRPAEPVLTFTDTSIAQGYIEQSNVNPVMEMAHLIAITRAFESITASLNVQESTMRDSIRTLAGDT